MSYTLGASWSIENVNGFKAGRTDFPEGDTHACPSWNDPGAVSIVRKPEGAFFICNGQVWQTGIPGPNKLRADLTIPWLSGQGVTAPAPPPVVDPITIPVTTPPVTTPTNVPASPIATWFESFLNPAPATPVTVTSPPVSTTTQVNVPAATDNKWLYIGGGILALMLLSRRRSA